MDAVYGVILAGGLGERLWPLSRRKKPKQLLCVNQNKTLLAQAIGRLKQMNLQNIYVTTSQEYVSEIEREVGNREVTIIAEPAARNTGPAMLYTCLEIYKRNPHAILLFVPADAFIPDSASVQFCQTLHGIIQWLYTHDGIALCGVSPTYAASEYGYITYDVQQRIDSLYRMCSFHEKPSQTIASQYLRQKGILWNIGLFGARIETFIAEFRRCAPQIVCAMDDYLCNRSLYEHIPAESIDRAVIEKSDKTWVMPANFSWTDVGNLEKFLSIKAQYTPATTRLVQVDACNNLINVSHKLVAIVGVDDLCIVETKDALVITKRSDVEKVRDVVLQLKQKKQLEYL